MTKEVYMKAKLTYMIIGITAVMMIGLGQAYARGTCFSMLDRIPGITLDDSQKATLETKETDYRKKMIRLKADYAVARVDKETLMKDKNFKKDQVEKQIRKMMDIETNIEMARLEALDELRKVLTDEQWKTFSTHMGKWFEGKGKNCMRSNAAGGHHMGKGSGMGPDPDEAGMKNCPFAGQAAKE